MSRGVVPNQSFNRKPLLTSYSPECVEGGVLGESGVRLARPCPPAPSRTRVGPMVQDYTGSLRQRSTSSGTETQVCLRFS
jgi:hypothetical protein